MKKKEIIHALTVLLNDKDNYDVSVKKGEEELNLNFKYKVTPWCKKTKYSVEDYPQYQDIIKKEIEKDKKIEQYTKKILPFAEYIFDSKVELEDFFTKLLTVEGKYPYFDYENLSIGYTTGGGFSMEIITFIAKIEII
jgi:hypothetical protein